MASLEEPNAQNLAFVEELYQRYLQDPREVDESWRRYFAEMEGSDGPRWRALRPGRPPSFQPRGVFNPLPAGNGHDGQGAPAWVATSDVEELAQIERQQGVQQLI